MKVFKRNAVIITVLLFVGVAVYLNWSYNRGQDLAADAPGLLSAEQVLGEEQGLLPGGENGEATPEDSLDPASLFFGTNQAEHELSASAMSYFANARLTRQQARDSATALLQDAAAIATASQEEIDNAIAAITTMANFSIQEAQLENLLMAKDFTECVIFIREDGVSVIVSAPPEGLSQAAVAQITDAVVSELGIRVDQITIIPVS